MLKLEASLRPRTPECIKIITYSSSRKHSKCFNCEVTTPFFFYSLSGSRGVRQGRVHQGSEWTQLIRRSSLPSLLVRTASSFPVCVCGGGRVCFNSQFDLIVIWSALYDTEKMTTSSRTQPKKKKTLVIWFLLLWAPTSWKDDNLKPRHSRSKTVGAWLSANPLSWSALQQSTG